MKAARFYADTRRVRIDDVPIPEIGPNEVLVNIRACGICGSDVHILEGVTPVPFSPITLGHEMSGVIAQVGRDVAGWKVGDRVCCHCVVSCGICENCRAGRMNVCVSRQLLGIHKNGGLAEYCAVPANMLIRLPDQVSFEIGAIVTDAVATPYHALLKVGGLQLGATVAIFGLGGLGYNAVKLAALAGAATVIGVDVLPESLQRAKQAGADYVINSREENPVQAIQALTGGGVDIAAEFCGKNVTIDQAVRSTRIGGRTVLCGIGPEPLHTLAPTMFVRQECQLLGSYSYTVTEIEHIIRLAASGKLDLYDAITECLPLERTEEALEHLQNKTGNPIRIVITQGS